MFPRRSSNIERWQKDIFYQINRASLVVIVLGTRESLRDKHWGLAWEVATLVAMDLPHKVLLLFPPVSDEELAARWEAMKALGVEIGLKMPAELPSEPICATFAPDWACQILPYRGRKTGDYRLALRETIVDLDEMKGRGRRARIGAIVIGVPVLAADYYFGNSVGDVVTTAAVASGVGATIGFRMR